MGSQAQICEAEFFPISLPAQRHPISWGFLQGVEKQRLKTNRTFQNQAPRTSSCHFPAQHLSVHHHSHMTKEEDIRVREGDKPGDQSSGKSWKCSICSARPAGPSQVTAHRPRGSYEISGLQSPKQQGASVLPQLWREAEDNASNPFHTLEHALAA